VTNQVQVLFAPEAATIREAMEVIDSTGIEISILVDAEQRLLGVVTDGDVRRALLSGAGLDDRVMPFASLTPFTVPPSAARADVVDLMRSRSIKQVPVVSNHGRVVGIHTIQEMISAQVLPNWAVVMAGGRGTRLGELSQTRPKPLTPVAGRPILEWIVLNLVGAGIRRIFLTVNHLGELIEEHFGDGADFGCTIDYVREDTSAPLGTAGSLSLLPEVPTNPLLVMNGDLMTTVRADRLLNAHAEAGHDLTVATKEYAHEIPYGVVDVEERSLVGIREKPVLTWPVSAGVYAMSPSVVTLVPLGREFLMTELVTSCLDQGMRVGVWPMDGDWLDVGRPSDLNRARGHQ